MRKIALIAAVLLCSASLASYAQMSDEQVIEYVKTASAAGKSQEDITKELLLRGVTQEQAERIKARVQSGQVTGNENAFGEDDGDDEEGEDEDDICAAATSAELMMSLSKTEKRPMEWNGL